MSSDVRQFAVRLPTSLVKRLDKLTARRRKETGIGTLTRADVLRALIEKAVTAAEKQR